MQVCLRKLMIDMVLGTDMKQHVTIISRFQTTLQVKLHSRMMTTAGCTTAASAESLAVKFEDPADRSMLLQVTACMAWPYPKEQTKPGKQSTMLDMTVCVCVYATVFMLCAVCLSTCQQDTTCLKTESCACLIETVACMPAGSMHAC